jgi:hypothetical protein
MQNSFTDVHARMLQNGRERFTASDTTISNGGVDILRISLTKADILQK